MLSIGRGNAKTALSAGIALGHLMGEIAPQPKREIIFAARNRDQAKVAFGFLEGLPEEDRKQFTIRRGSKLEVETAEAGGGLARVIAADGKSILGGARRWRSSMNGRLGSATRATIWRTRSCRAWASGTAGR